MLVPRLTPDRTMSGLRSFSRCLTANSTQSVGVPSMANLVSLTSRARIGREIDSEWPAPLWLNSGATTQTSLDSWRRDLDQRLEPRRMDAVVVGDEDARARELGKLHFAFTGPGIVSSPPM